MHRARERLVRLAREHGISLRQSYVRLGKRALVMQGRYRHAKQHKRANKALRKLKTYLGRTTRDIRRKMAGDEDLHQTFLRPLWLAERVLTQKRRDPLPKVYSLHAPEVECIGKGKAHKPYEFGCKVSVAATNNRAPGGQFVTHVKAFHGNPYDGHTLGTVIAEMERWTGIEAERIYVDKGYAGHDYPNKRRVYRSGQKRGLTPTIRRELRRRSAIEAVIGHMKTDGRLGRNFLKGSDGDRINAILVGAGYNYRLVLKWLRLLIARIMAAILNAMRPPIAAPVGSSA
jgi:IS5 family transposase